MSLSHFEVHIGGVIVLISILFLSFTIIYNVEGYINDPISVKVLKSIPVTDSDGFFRTHATIVETDGGTTYLLRTGTKYSYTDYINVSRERLKKYSKKPLIIDGRKITLNQYGNDIIIK